MSDQQTTVKISSEPFKYVPPEPMKIIKGYPPNYAVLLKRFGDVVRGDVIFAYGDRIFYPKGTTLHPALIAHEEEHGHRQRAMGVELWWEKYIDDREFRFVEEAIAHNREWNFFRMMTNPMPSEKQKRDVFKHICERLSGPLYGGAVTLDHARKVVSAMMISTVEMEDGRHVEV